MRRSVSFFLLAAVVACSQAEVSNPFDRGAAATNSIVLNAANNNFNEATIRAVGRTQRRLGTVPGNGRESFTLDWPVVSDLQIEIDILAGDTFTTNRITVSPGETAYLLIENPIYRSQLRR